jgi:hypothetical protein
LRSVAIERDGLAPERLENEVGHHTAIVGMHAGAIGIEDAAHFDPDPVLAVVIEEKRFRTPLALIVARPGTDGVDASPIGLRLGMDRGIPIHLRSGGLKDLGLQSFRQPQHVDGPVNVHLGGLNRVVLIVNGRSRTRQIVNLIDLHIKRKGNVVTKEFKIGISDQMSDISLGPRIEIVHTEDIVSILEETLAEMGTQKPRPSGH